MDPEEVYFDPSSVQSIQEALGFDGYYSGNEALPEPLALALVVPDLDGDSGCDVLAQNITTDPETGAVFSEISAFSGRNGSVLWKKEYPNALALATSAGDLDGDGQNDVIVNVVLATAGLVPYSGVAAVDGSSGREIWSRPELLAITFAYPLRDINGDSAADLVVHLFGIDSLNNSLVTRISAVDGASGHFIDSRVFSKSIAIEYPAGNLTADQLPDSVRCIWGLADNPENVSTTIAAANGSDHSDLWSTEFIGCLALALPIPDLSGDGKDDLLAYIMRLEDEEGQMTLALLQGSDGAVQWARDYGSSLPLAFAGADLSGEGFPDLMVYKIGTGYDEEAEVEAVKGDDGTLLWSRGSTLLLPS